MKHFLDFYKERDDAFILAKRIYDDGFIPDILYSAMRGGAIMANAISEWYKQQPLDKPILYAAVCARSYKGQEGFDERGEVVVDGWTYAPSHLKTTDKVMLVDDIYDSGATLNTLANVFLNLGLPRENLKIVVHTYKSGLHIDDDLIKPDYWCNEDDEWLHFLSHELAGLTDEEKEIEYYSKNPALRGVL
jgi:hypoxanthine phosphoribosyltransferase